GGESPHNQNRHDSTTGLCAEGGRSYEPELLPNIRHKTMLDLFLVFPITRQIVCKESLFVKKPPYQEWCHDYERKQPPIRAERKRSTNEVQQCTCVHRMAHH